METHISPVSEKNRKPKKKVCMSKGVSLKSCIDKTSWEEIQGNQEGSNENVQTLNTTLHGFRNEAAAK